MSRASVVVPTLCAFIAVAAARAEEGKAAAPEQQALFRSGEGDYHTYRIPALIVTTKGTLLAFCEGRKKGRGDAGDIDMLLRRSTDGGKTWGKAQVVWDDGDNTCGNPCPVIDRKTGTVWLLMTHNLGRDTEAQILDGKSQGTRTVWVTRSDDDGLTWAKPVEITRDVKKDDWTWYATGPGVGIRTKNGRLVVPCDNYVKGSKERQAHVILSDDGGKTWKLGGGVGPDCNESQVVERADGALLLNMRSYRGTNRRLVAVSKDGGETFSKPEEDRALIEPVCQASIVRDPGDRGGILFSNPASTKRERMTVRLSTDEGKTWAHAKVLHEGPAAYSCLAVLPDGTIACLYERGDKGAYETITLARFSREWLAEGPAPDPGGLTFSVMTWEGDYGSHDVPGGVETTPVEGAIYTIRGDGTELKKIVNLGKRTSYPAYNPDGRWVYFQSDSSGRSHVYRCTPEGKDVTILTDGDRLGKSWKSAYGYVLSRDGRHMLYTVHDGTTGRVALADADGGNPRLLFPKLGYTYMGALSPAGDRVVVSGPARGYRLLIADLPDGEPRELTPDHPDSFVPQFTPDGKVIVFLRRDGDVYRVDADGKNLRRLTEGSRHVEFRLSVKDTHGSTDGPDVSPDGKRIAYIAVRDGVANVWVMNIDGSAPRQVTNRKTDCGRARWSPDGRQLAFVSFEGKYPQLFTIAADGVEPRQLTRLDGAVYFVNWRPFTDRR
jgi:sialidase-1